jgi:superfamily II DNA or RNA helicase
VETLKELRRAHALGQEAGLVVLPPGSGKTRIAAEDAKYSGAKKVLYVAHTHEILDVAQSEFEAKFGQEKVQKCLGSDSLQSFNTINLATIQLLHKKAPQQNLWVDLGSGKSPRV